MLKRSRNRYERWRKANSAEVQAHKTAEAATDLLVALGNEESTIVRKLVKGGIKGTPGDPDNCPISRLLSKELGMHCRTGEDSSFIYKGIFKRIIHPTPVSLLIRHFDHGLLPELEEDA